MQSITLSVVKGGRRSDILDSLQLILLELPWRVKGQRAVPAPLLYNHAVVHEYPLPDTQLAETPVQPDVQSFLTHIDLELQTPRCTL